MSWQPIETAPRGEWFLGLDAGRTRYFIAYWIDDEQYPYSYNGGAYFNDLDLWKLTHWQPLPEPPTH